MEYSIVYPIGKFLFGPTFKFVFGKELYEMEPFIDHVDKHIIPLLGKNTNDRLLNVIAISHYITKSFKNEHGQTLSAEDIGILMGSDDYKDMDYSKATHVIKNVFIVSASAVNYRHEQKNLPKRYQSRAICASPPPAGKCP